MGCVPSTLCKLIKFWDSTILAALKLFLLYSPVHVHNLNNNLCDQKTTNKWVLPYTLTFLSFEPQLPTLGLPHCFWHCMRFEAFVSMHHCMCAFLLNLFSWKVKVPFGPQSRNFFSSALLDQLWSWLSGHWFAFICSKCIQKKKGIDRCH